MTVSSMARLAERLTDRAAELAAAQAGQPLTRLSFC